MELEWPQLMDPTGRGDVHGDVDAVGKANVRRPEQKAHDGGVAVRLAAAAA